MDKNAKHYPLNVTMPQHCAYVVRDLPQATVEQRERALNATHWNEFAFPSGMLTVDMLSDSGTTAMTNQQWATLFLGDEAYGRNTGYYVLLDTFRDIFERGGEKNWKKVIDLVRTDCRDIEKMMDEVYLCEYEGGLFNGGAAQMERPNAFIIQQGRAAESVLMEIVKKILAQRHPGKVFTIPSNGHFDTTEGNIKQMGSIPRNLYNKELLYEIPEGGSYEKNPFKGNMDIEKLEQLIQAVGPENVPLVFTCITNNPICGQPVSMANIREINRVAHKYDIPLVFDVARWAENCYFIKMNEEGYADKSIAEIASEGYKYIFTLKPEGLLNPQVWVFAFGQAFFSLSVAGNGSVIYGSYLPKDEDLPSSARNVALFDTIAALLAAIVIIPAMAVILGDGIVEMKGGPGLMFVYLVNVFNAMPGGRIVGMIFYICVLFAGVSSIVNLYEAPVAFLQEKLHTNRVLSVVIIGVVGGVIALCIQPWTSQWMDVVSIYICPLGALLAGIMFFWVMKKDTALAAVYEGRTAGKKDISGWFYPLGKWVYCAASLAALILGAIYGGIG